MDVHTGSARRTAKSAAVLLLAAAGLVTVPSAAVGQPTSRGRPTDTPTCFGQPATIVGLGDGAVIKGTQGDDVIVGTMGGDTIYGRGGNDLICSGDGGDRVYGAGGDDKIDGGTGPDFLLGGKGDDLILGGPGDDTIRPDIGSFTVDGGDGTDWLDFYVPHSTHLCPVYLDLAAGTGHDLSARICFGKFSVAGIENVNATGGADVIKGDAGPNVIVANGGAARIYGRGGDDTLDGYSPGQGAYANGGPGMDICTRFATTDKCETTS